MNIAITLTHQVLVDMIALLVVSVMMMTALVVSVGAIIHCLLKPTSSDEVVVISPEKAAKIQAILDADTRCYFPTLEQACQHLEIDAEVQDFLRKQ